MELALLGGAPVGHGASLLVAAEMGDTDILALLLDQGARTDIRFPDASTVLHVAARHGHHAAVAMLIGAIPEAARKGMIDAVAGPRHRSALQDAVGAASVATVRTLLAAGAHPNHADTFGQTPLHGLGGMDVSTAAELAVQLLAAGADPSLADARGFTALHIAALADNPSLVQVLLAGHPALRDEKTPLGESPVDVALRYGRDRAAERLIREGAAPSNERAWPPLHEAARMDALPRAADLIATGADITRRFERQTALDVAIKFGSKRVERLLRAVP